MKNPKDTLNKIIHRFYYYVPPCPICNDSVTGHFVKLHRDVETDWQINESLRHGELIKAVQEVPARNCFCVNCGYEWTDEVRLLFISQERINKEKEARLTTEILNERINEQRELQKKDRSLFKPIKRFVGKL